MIKSFLFIKKSHVFVGLSTKALVTEHYNYLFCSMTQSQAKGVIKCILTMYF